MVRPMSHLRSVDRRQRYRRGCRARALAQRAGACLPGASLVREGPDPAPQVWLQSAWLRSYLRLRWTRARMSAIRQTATVALIASQKPWSGEATKIAWVSPGVAVVRTTWLVMVMLERLEDAFESV